MKLTILKSLLLASLLLVTPIQAQDSATQPASKPTAKPPKPAPVVWTQTTDPKNDYSKDPAKTLILNPNLPWSEVGWQGGASAVGSFRKENFTRFIVNDPGGREVWYRRISSPPLWERYPIAVIRYRATGLSKKNFSYGLWIDDGKGPYFGGITALQFEHFIPDGQIHEVRADLRLCPIKKAKPPGSIIGSLTFALKADPGQQLIFDLYEIRFEADSEKPNPPIALDCQGTVKLVNTQGEPVFGAMIKPAAEWANLAPEVRTNSLGEARMQWGFGESFGGYAYPNYKPSLQISASKPGFYTSHTSVFTPVAFGSQLRMFPAARISGTLVDDQDKPVAGAGIEIDVTGPGHDDSRENRIYATSTVVTDSQGKWETDPLPALISPTRISSVKISDTRYVTRTYSIDSPAKPLSDITLNGQTGNKFIIRKGVILTGRVLDKDNKPIPNADVKAGRSRDNPQGRIDELQARSDKMGHFQIGPFPVGQHTFQVSAGRYAPQFPSVKVTDLDTPVSIDVNLKAAKAIKAQIVTPDGKPIAGAIVASPQWEGQSLEFSTTSKVDGKFTWTNPPQGTVPVTIFLKDRPSDRYIIPLVPSDEEYTVTLLDQRRFTVSPALTPGTHGLAPAIPAPETLREPDPEKSLSVPYSPPTSRTSQFIRHPQQGDSDGGVTSPEYVSLQLLNAQFFGRQFNIFSIPGFTGQEKLKKLVIRYRATTSPQWQPNIPMTSGRDLIGLNIGSNLDTYYKGPSIPDFVPDGKIRELVLDISPSPLAGDSPRSNNAYFLQFIRPTTSFGDPQPAIQSLNLDLLKVWVESSENIASFEKPFKHQVKVFQANGKPAGGVTVKLLPAGRSQLTATTDATGIVQLEGNTLEAPSRSITASHAGMVLATTPLTDNLTTIRLPSSFKSAPEFEKSEPVMLDGQVLASPTSSAVGAQVWITRQPYLTQDTKPVLTDERGRYLLAIPDQGLNCIAPPPGFEGQPLRVYARLGDLAAVALIPKQGTRVNLPLQPMVRPILIVTGIDLTTDRMRNFPTIRFMGYGSAQLTQVEGKYVYIAPPLIADDVVYMFATAQDHLPVILQFKVKESMPPLVLEFKPAHQVQVTYLDEDGAPIPDLAIITEYGGNVKATTNAKGQATFKNMLPGGGRLNILRTRNELSAYIGTNTLIIPVPRNSPQVLPNVSFVPYWSCKLSVLDAQTGHPIQTAYASATPSEWGFGSKAQTPAQAQTEIDGQNMCAWVPVPGAASTLKVMEDKTRIIVFAKGYKLGTVELSKSDPRPRTYQIKLEKDSTNP